jgi:hypothetical protein
MTQPLSHVIANSNAQTVDGGTRDRMGMRTIPRVEVWQSRPAERCRRERQFMPIAGNELSPDFPLILSDFYLLEEMPDLGRRGRSHGPKLR